MAIGFAVGAGAEVGLAFLAFALKEYGPGDVLIQIAGLPLRLISQALNISLVPNICFFMVANAICFGMLGSIAGVVYSKTFSPYHRRRKRKKLGLCVKCGYDLRGSKDRCPECGTEMQENGALGTMTDDHEEHDHT